MTLAIYVVAILILGAVGYGVYQQQNTIAEVSVGSHSISVQKN